MNEKNKFGPHNPHPLSQMRTELVWEGKYDEFGQRREVDVAGLAMPLQKIETIDDPRSRAEAQGSLFDEKKAHRDDFRNRLIWGDNKLVMASLLSEFKGSIDLIYIDPPFDVGADFSCEVPIGEKKKDFISKENSIIEMIAYRDMWGRGTNSYLSMMYERLSMMKGLLSETGTIFLHCDWHVGQLLRCVLDEVFGASNFKNEIVWHYRRWPAKSPLFQRSHDTIFWYGKSKGHKWHQLYDALSEATLKRFGGKKVRGETTKEVLDEESAGAPMRDVWDIPHVLGANPERVDYPTQKPLQLIKRIIESATDEDSIVADFFCGSGTTAIAAEQLGRKWIVSDLGRFAIHTATKRLIETQRQLNDSEQAYRSFDVYNLGRYERQWWQQEALKGAEEEHRSVVLNFFRAEILSSPPSPLLHGRKGTALVHVDGIDSIFTREELSEVAKSVKAAGGKQVHCLAWDFEMDIRQSVSAVESELGISIKLHRIPREIMEKNRTEVPPFFEMALLEAEPVSKKAGSGKSKTVDVKLVNFLPSLTEVPGKELEALQERAVKSGFDFIDFWAVDFDWHPNKPFNHHWQDYRTRKDRTLKTVSDAAYVYERSGKHTICVKVVDVFGCDTSITVEVEV